MNEQRALSVARERYGPHVEFVYSTDGLKITDTKTGELYGIGISWAAALGNAKRRDVLKKRESK